MSLTTALPLKSLGDILEIIHGMALPEFTIWNIISIGCQAAMVFGGVVPFIPQYRDIKKSGNAEGFSTFVCLTLLIANILRIMFWFGKHFELPLLAQSIIMVFTMLMLVHLCVKVKNKSEIVASKTRRFFDSDKQESNGDVTSLSYTNQQSSPPLGGTFLDFDMAYFWRWTNFSCYVQFLVVFSMVVGFFTWLLLENKFYVETIGFLAVFAEAMLGAPQFYRNFQNKSTQGMSKKMVGFWTCGDIFKTGYFILREAPAQFWICGMLQVSIDISIFIQVFMYRNLPPGRTLKPAVR